MLSSLSVSSVTLSMFTFVSCFFSERDDLNFLIFISLRLATSQSQSLKKTDRPLNEYTSLICTKTFFSYFLHLRIDTLGFVLIWAFEIPWLSMTFSMTFQIFPWPKFDHFSWKFSTIILISGTFYHFLDKKITCLIYFVQSIPFFHDFPWPTLKFHDFSGLENEILRFHDVSGFPRTARTLYLPSFNIEFALTFLESL